MKNLTATLIAQITAMIIGGLLVCSCEKPTIDNNSGNEDQEQGENDNQNENETLPEIHLDSTVVRIDFLSGEMSLGYEIVHPAEDTYLSVKKEGDWLTLDETSTDKISFSYGQNRDQKERTATLKLQYGEVSAEVSIIQSAYRHPRQKEFIGRYEISHDRMDLDMEGYIFYLYAEDGQNFAIDEDGNYITCTVREYCEQYAEDYNADSKNAEKITAEDVAVTIYDEENELYGLFAINNRHINFDWGLGSDGSYLLNTKLNGDYTYDESTGIITIEDESIAHKPKTRRIQTSFDENGQLCLSFGENYIVKKRSYDEQKAYLATAYIYYYLVDAKKPEE